MNLKTLRKIKRELQELRKSPFNRSYKIFVSYAEQLGRYEENRGKEPNFVRKRDPALSPPLSIPKHSGDMKPGTVRSIVDQLLSDVDDWELFLLENEEDEQYGKAS
jgi:hypothetical protein